MRRPRHDQQRHIRHRQPRQVFDFMQMVHAHFQHRITVMGVETQQHLRHANVVVEIALGGEHAVAVTTMRRQNGAQHFLDGGFAVAAGEGNNRQRKAAAPELRELCVCPQRVTHHNLRNRHILFFGNQRRRRASGLRAGHILVAVKIFTLDGDKQFTRQYAAAVSGNTVKRRALIGVWQKQCCAELARAITQCHGGKAAHVPRPGHAAMASAATSTSLK